MMERTPTHDENCCICCEPLIDHPEPEKLELMTTTCGHWMHQHCWQEFQTIQGPNGVPGEDCPVCRRRLSGNQVPAPRLSGNPVPATRRWAPSVHPGGYYPPQQHSGWIDSPVPAGWVRHYYADGLSSDNVRPYVQWNPANQPDRISIPPPSITGFLGGGNPPEGYYAQTLGGGVKFFVRRGSPEDYRRPGAVAPRPLALSVLERRRELLGLPPNPPRTQFACQATPATRSSNTSPILGITDSSQRRADITLLFERAPATDAAQIAAVARAPLPWPARDPFNTFPGVAPPNYTASASFGFNSISEHQLEQQQPAPRADLSVRPKTRRIHKIQRPK
jgi:hypothetical protein